MNKHEFKVGDVVTLKSGGPPMTVNEVLNMSEDTKGCIKCRWFDVKKQLKKGEFSPDSLEVSKGEPSDLAALLFAEEKG